MAALRLSGRLLALVTTALLVLAGPAGAQDTDPAAVQAAPDPLAALQAAEAAFLEADFERSLELARVTASALEGRPSPEPAASRAPLARALDLIAQSLYNLGNEAGMKDVIERLVALEPGYVVDAETAGQRYVERFDERRNALTGMLQVVCAPLPCESVRIGERELELDEAGEARVFAGTLRVVVRRHAFREQVLEGVEIAPGERKSLSVDLTQIARDVVLRTKPPGVGIWLDGEEIGTTQPSGQPAEPSEPLVLLEVEPGVRSVVLKAPCLRRIERRLDVTLDRLEPGPIELGVIELEPVHSELEIAWEGVPATFLLDESPVEPGVQKLCPGTHSLSVSVGGRRVWFEEFELAPDEAHRIAPSPRPTLALPAQLGETLAGGAAAWNRVALEDTAADGIVRALGSALASAPPGFPEVVKGSRPEIAGILRRFAPEADLVVLALPGADAVGRTRRLVLLAPVYGAFESTLVSEDELARVVGEALSREWQAFETYVGVDLFERRDGSVVVAGVAKGGPGAAAGLEPGEVLLSMGGADRPTLEQALETFASAARGQELVISLQRLDGERRDAILKPASTLRSPFPESLEGPFLLPLLARALVWRAAGAPGQRMAGSLLSGLSLAALGLDEAAAKALDLASVDRSVDLAGDARGTITWLLEATLRRLGEPYADEVKTRLGGMDEARLGGREGPPLGWRPR